MLIEFYYNRKRKKVFLSNRARDIKTLIERSDFPDYEKITFWRTDYLFKMGYVTLEYLGFE